MFPSHDHTEYYNKVEAKTLEEAIEKVRNNLLPDYEQIDDAETPVENVSSTNHYHTHINH